tara:strand:+ start:668 stop:1000 length:333 start_codon:yes stop_codon:yes gene_type:complete
LSITYTWSVNQMDAYPELDGETDVVFNVHWSLAATDGTYHGYAYGTQPVPLAEDVSFTPFEDLTEVQVVGWVQEAMGPERVSELEANAAAQIEVQVNPPVVAPVLPWDVA